MVSLGKAEDASEQSMTIPFSRLVHGQPRWEVCRRFLTCLILTNQGNTDIVFDNESERINNFNVKLLEAKVKHLSLYGEEEPAIRDVSKASGMRALPSPVAADTSSKCSIPRIPDHSPAHVHQAVH